MDVSGHCSAVVCAFPVQKPNGECHTNFKRTKSREQVVEALDSFVESNTQIVVSVTFTDLHLSVISFSLKICLFLLRGATWDA